MAIPNTSRTPSRPSGLPGNLAFDGPIRARTAVIDTATEANNVFGRAFTVKDAVAGTVQAGGAGKFAGIMINPKTYAQDKATASNGTVGEFLAMGEVYAVVAGSPAVGGLVYFIQGDGSLTTVNTNTLITNATIARTAPGTGGLCVLSLTGPIGS